MDVTQLINFISPQIHKIRDLKEQVLNTNSSLSPNDALGPQGSLDK